MRRTLFTFSRGFSTSSSLNARMRAATRPPGCCSMPLGMKPRTVFMVSPPLAMCVRKYHHLSAGFTRKGLSGARATHSDLFRGIRTESAKEIVANHPPISKLVVLFG